MEHSRELILQAEEQIQQMADQLSRAKQVVDSVETVEQLLQNAFLQVDAARKTLESAHQQSSNALNDTLRLVQRSVQQLEHTGQSVAQTSQQLVYTLQQQISAHFTQQNQQIQTIATEIDRQVQRVTQTSQEAISSGITLMARLKDETAQSLHTLVKQIEAIEQTTAKQTKVLYFITALLIVALIVSTVALVISATK